MDNPHVYRTLIAFAVLYKNNRGAVSQSAPLQFLNPIGTFARSVSANECGSLRTFPTARCNQPLSVVLSVPIATTARRLQLAMCSLLLRYLACLLGFPWGAIWLFIFLALLAVILGG